MLILAQKLKILEPTGNDGDNDNELIHKTSASTRIASEDITHEEETSFIEGSDHTPLITREQIRDYAWERMNVIFPDVGTDKFLAKLDDFGRVIFRLAGVGKLKILLIIMHIAVHKIYFYSNSFYSDEGHHKCGRNVKFLAQILYV